MPVSEGLLPGFFRVAARIHSDRHEFKSQVLWFDFPAGVRSEVSGAGDGWLLACLPLAFRLGETLRIAAPIDPTLLDHIGEIQRIWLRWVPSLAPVRIESELKAQPDREGAGRTGLFFSGGVDSFFSALHWDSVACANRTEGFNPVDDLINVWGFDIPLRHRRAFARKRVMLETVARELGKGLLIVVTNLRETALRSLHWGTVMHGPALGAVGALLGRRFSRLVISAGLQPGQLDPWGSHPEVDPWMSTSRTRFVYYGGEVDRVDKTAFIARSPVALRHLHVCWREGSDRNCGRCEKCFRTLLTLELLGARDRAASFPRDGFSLESLPRVWEDHPLVVNLYRELQDHARELGRSDVAEAIDVCLSRYHQGYRVPRKSRLRRMGIRLAAWIRKSWPFGEPAW